MNMRALLRKEALKIALIYFVISFFWILFSDMLLKSIFSNYIDITRFQTFKGWFFVFATSLIIYYLVRREIQKKLNINKLLQKQEEKYSLLIDNHPAVVWSTYQNGKTNYISSNIERIYGYTPDEICNNDKELWIKRIHPNDVDLVTESFTKLFVENKEYNVEYRIKHKHGNWIWLNDRAKITENIKGEKYAFGIFVEITEKKNVELLIKESEVKYRMMFENANDGISLLKADRFIDCNSKLVEMFGCTKEEFIGNSPVKFSPDYQSGGMPSSSKALEYINKAYEGINVRFEWKHKRMNGELFDAEISLNPVEINGEILIQAIIRDISERKKVEKQLQNEKEFTDRILNAQNDTVFVFDYTTGKALRWNKIFNKYSGYSDEEILSLKAPDSYFGTEDLDKAELAIQEIIDQGYSKFELSLISKDKKSRPFEYIASLEKDSEGNPLYIISVGRDITEHKMGQEKIMRLTNLLDESQSLAKIGGWEIDLLQNSLYWTDETYKIHDTSRSEYTPTVETAINFYAPEWVPVITAAVQEAIDNGKGFSLELELITAKNRRIWVDVSSRIIKANSRVVKILGAFQDITNRKNAEKKLKESEAKFKKLSNLTFEGIVIHDKGFATEINLSIAKMFGYKIEELLGQNLIELIIPKKHHKIVSENITNQYASPYEVEGIKKDGSTLPIELESRNILSIDDNKTIRVTAVRDISLRKKAEKEIRKLSIAVEQSANAITITDIDGHIEYTNQRFTELTGFASDEVLGQIPRILQAGTQSKEFYNELWQTIKGGIPWRGETQDKTKTNEPFWEQATITPTKDKDGNITNYLYVREDITLRKKAEQALIESENRFRTIVENISDGLVILDNEGEFLSVNSAYCKMHGYSLKDILNLKVSDVLHEDNSKSFENYNEFIIKNGFWDEDVIARHKNGSKVFIHIKARVFNYNQDQAILVIVSDISERKKMEQKILKSIIQTEEKERARYAKDLHDGLGPIFSTVKLYFQWLTETEDPDKRKFIIEKGNENIQEAITTLREISNNLNPHVLVNYGLIEAVQIFINKLSENELIKFNYQTDLNERFSEEIEITLYRVITELINNTLKYAEATEVIIKLAKKEKKRILELYYSDNGQGFNMEEVLKKKEGLGIFNIKNRIESVGGDMSILTKPNKGVVVEIKVKLED